MKGKVLLNALLADLAKETGKATSEEQAKEMELQSYLYLENAPVYGGYRLIAVNINNGGHDSPLPGLSSCDARQKAPIMEQTLRMLIKGIQIGKNLKGGATS